MLPQELQKPIPKQELLNSVLARLKESQLAEEASKRHLMLLTSQIIELKAQIALNKQAAEAEREATEAERKTATVKFSARDKLIELQKMEIATLGREIASLQRKLATQDSRLATTRVQSAADHKHLQAVEEEKKSLVMENHALREENAKLQAELERRRLSSPRYTSQIDELKKKLSEAYSQLDRVQAENNKLNEKLNLADKNIANLKELNTRVSEMYKTIKDQLELLKADHFRLLDDIGALTRENLRLVQKLDYIQRNSYSYADMQRLYPIVLKQLSMYECFRKYCKYSPFIQYLFEMTRDLCIIYNLAWKRIDDEPKPEGKLIVDTNPRDLPGEVPLPKSPIVVNNFSAPIATVFGKSDGSETQSDTPSQDISN